MSFAAAIALVCVSGLMSLASWIMFMLFLKQVGEYLDEWSISRQAVQLIFKGLFIIVGTAIVGFILYMLMRAAIPLLKYAITYIIFLMFGLVILVIMIFWLIFILKFVMEQLELIASLRQEIYSRF